jgi:hypothetical protein
MHSGDETDSLQYSSPSHSDEEDATMGATVELDAQAGARSPPAKRVRLSPSPSPSFEYEEYSEEDDSEPGPDSPDSCVLNLFHAEGSEESKPGINLHVQDLYRRYQDH